MRILITGVRGMLGTAIKEVFKEYDLLLTDKDNLDMAYWIQLEPYLNSGIETVIHLAAETNLEACEANPAQAYFTNSIGTLNMKLFCAKLDIPIIYISTAGIFDGKRGYYEETDIPNPPNHYGRSKLYGEYMLADYPKKYILRAGWMMGSGKDTDKKFVNLIFKQIQQGQKIIYAYEEYLGSPTYTYDLAKTIKNFIIHKPEFGIYNCAGEGIASRFDVAKALVEYLGLKDVEVKKATPEFFNSIFPCQRSNNEVLFNNKVRTTGLSCMRDWRISLKEYVKKCYKPYLT